MNIDGQHILRHDKIGQRDIQSLPINGIGCRGSPVNGNIRKGEAIQPQIGDDGNHKRIESSARLVGIKNGLVNCDGVRVIVNGCV